MGLARGAMEPRSTCRVVTQHARIPSKACQGIVMPDTVCSAGYIKLSSHEAPRTPPQDTPRSLDTEPPAPSSPWGLQSNETFNSFSNDTMGAPQVSNARPAPPPAQWQPQLCT